MAQFLRLKLHAVCSSCLLSSARASNLLKSPDLRLTSWRWFGEGVLLEDHGDGYGGSMAGNQEDSLAKGFEGIKGGATSRVSALDNLDTDKSLESSLGKLTGLVSEKSETNSSISNVRKGTANQTQSEEINKSAKDDKWQKMVSSVRSMAFKKKIKAGDTNDPGLLKTGQHDSQLDFSDLDLPQAESASQGPTVSRKESLASNSFSKSSKQRIAQSESLKQRKSKDPDEFFVFQDSSHFEKKAKQQQPKQKLLAEELLQDFCEPPEIHKDFPFPTNRSKVYYSRRGLDPASKNEAQEPPFKLPPGSDDALMSAKGSISRDMARQASSNSDGISKQTYMVCIRNLPPTCNPSVVKASMAVHGEVTGVFKKPVRDRLSAYIQFKTVEAMESALASRKLQIGSKTCYITRTDNSIFTTVVRVSKVSNDTDEGQLRSVCEQFGKVDDVRKRAYGVFDVIYDVKELMNIPSILASLSEVNLNRTTWFALPAPLVHPSMQKEVFKTLEGQSWHDIQVNNSINRIEAGLDAVSVLFEDLKQLNTAAREYTR